MPLRLPAILSAILLTAACGGSGTGAAPGDTAPIDEIRNKYVAAYNAGDAAGVAAVFADDAISMPDHHAPLEGKAAIESYLRDLFGQYSFMIAVTPGETEVLGDVAHEHGTFSITMTPKAGGPALTDNGKYLVILKRGSDGRWLVHHDIDNTNVPPAGAPAPSGAP
jgi:uncharacterized protein (TIGR02246 family)